VLIQLMKNEVSAGARLYYRVQPLGLYPAPLPSLGSMSSDSVRGLKCKSAFSFTQVLGGGCPVTSLVTLLKCEPGQVVLLVPLLTTIRPSSVEV
jgi:hypothetical protein